ncbi:translation factor [Lophiostoma macrostomum CBS 122681]|uniref:Threonylcarbamoyl-AMP synthase n=1 Tax=Lophiostoma macrostomum CBS 122681 TaxID=1314788 RepID=A0A6A6T7T1_9PLEO|nr:translation factor [Lophiostoma macrostomum CBS 122681]
MKSADLLPVDPHKLGRISFSPSTDGLVDDWNIEYESGSHLESLSRAASELATTSTPVAFPTETVYGLGADATRSSAVQAIFAAKGRPADNPLIVHIHSIPQLRSLLSPQDGSRNDATDPIPAIYKPLIQRFWPGPLTIILPNPSPSVLASEVTASLSTFGARMPRSILALALIRLAGVPLAAPSANASTRPSPTAAEHVYDDIGTRIHTIIDGGPCEVGVESTVVDGLSSPPTILRPGGVTVEELRRCPGWENVAVGYKDAGEVDLKPRAPGMKYRHYSPKARVVLYEAGTQAPDVQKMAEADRSVGIIRTKRWKSAAGSSGDAEMEQNNGTEINESNGTNGFVHHASDPLPPAGSDQISSQRANLLQSLTQHQVPHASHINTSGSLDIWEIDLGPDTKGVARGLFSALRELDKKGVSVILVEGIDDTVGDDIAAAVMNRLRKAAESRIKLDGE